MFNNKSTRFCVRLYELLHVKNWSTTTYVILMSLPVILFIVAILLKTEKENDLNKEKTFTPVGIALIIIAILMCILLAILLGCKIYLQDYKKVLAGQVADGNDY